MIIKDFISITIKEDNSNGMAVPKSRRSKLKGRIRLANWKKKAEKTSHLALNSAKAFFQKEKKEAELALLKDKNNEVENIEDENPIE